jgi:translocation and assembly module TamB
LPQAKLSISSDNGELTQQTELPLAVTWQQLNLNSTLADDTLQSNLTLALTDETRLDATANISQLQSDNRLLEGNIKLTRFALSLLQPLLGEFSELQGELSSELDLAGSLDQPLLNGQIDISNIRVKGKQAPVDIDDADIKLSLSGQQASLQGLVTTTRGEIKLSGDASWQQLSDWQAQVNITGDELRLQVPQARLLVAPDLVLKATPALTRLSGTVTIPQANINIDSLPQNAIELSNDLILLDEKLQPIPQQEKSVFIFETDINVLLGNRVRLSAFGLKTLLNGKLRVRQQPGRPLLLNGDVSLRDGTFRAYGQDLLIRKGKMNFNGPADQPFLNIEAIRNPDNMEDDVIAGIRVTGPADEPQVSIFSEPAKAQANALSYLIMGRDLDSSSGNTGNAVTTSLLGMTLASSSKAVGEIGEAFGLQDLTLDTAGSGDNSQVTVSGYLSRDLQLKYGYGIFNAVGEFTLRYRLMRRLYLEAVSGLDNAVDLLYKFEFD